MNFKHSCFTENTPENREWLEKLGYELENMHTEGEYILTYLRKHDRCELYWCAIPYKKIHLDSIPDLTIDCRSNPSLFKAVSAVREDSDKHQWFTNGKDWCKCYFDKFSHFAFHQQVESSMDLMVNWHKATLSELIEKFK